MVYDICFQLPYLTSVVIKGDFSKLICIISMILFKIFGLMTVHPMINT